VHGFAITISHPLTTWCTLAEEIPLRALFPNAPERHFNILDTGRMYEDEMMLRMKYKGLVMAIALGPNFEIRYRLFDFLFAKQIAAGRRNQVRANYETNIS
jgi:hypothetical protein